MPFQRNGGSGTARRIGTAAGPWPIVVWTDADMTYPNERIPEFVQYLVDRPHVDQVVGARTSEQGTYKLLRVPAKWTIRKLAESLAGTKIPDLNSGLRAFRRDVVAALPATAPARLQLRHHDHHVVPVQPAPGGVPADRVRQAGRYVASSTSSATPTGTSCRCCGWSCTSTRSRC